MAVPVAVDQAIRRAFGEYTDVVDVDQPGDWDVARLHLAGGAAPASVVAKWLRSNPQRWRTDPRQMAREVAGLRFADDRAPGLVPRVIAAELDHETGGVVLMEDLSPREPLDAIIRRDGVAATEQARQTYARAMGRLAAATAGHERDFRHRLDDLGTEEQARARLRLFGPPWKQQKRMLDEFGVRVSAAAEGEAMRLQRLLAEPGPFLTLTNGDMGENNFMINIDALDDGRLIDFEFAQFDHALAHAANFFVPSPRWMVIKDPIADRLESEFRSALATGVPEAADDELYQCGVAAGCVAMGFERCGNLPVMDARPPGHPSRAQRLATIEAAAAEAEARGRWPELTGLLRELARSLRSRWPDADLDFSTFAPYTPRQEYQPC